MASTRRNAVAGFVAGMLATGALFAPPALAGAIVQQFPCSNPNALSNATNGFSAANTALSETPANPVHLQCR
jgi:hypothetical protein